MKQQPGDFKKLGFREAHMEKREQLIAACLDPYPYSFSGAQKIGDIIAAGEECLGITATAAGRIWARRDAKNMVFIDLRDDSGKIQICFYKKDLNERAATILNCVDAGDILGVSGVVFRTEMKVLSIKVKSVEVLAKTVVPIPIGKETPQGIRDRLNDPESQYRERYLTWLLKDEERNCIITRSRIIDSIRRFMHDRRFLEVSTPAIEPIYGGAEARPFRTSIWALEGKEAFLRISPELYLKRYIVAGFDRVYTICQNFRNEGIDRSHNPEFTMMEWYEAYTDYEYQMTQFETLVAQVCMDIHRKTVISYQGVEIDFTPPWRRISVLDALLQEGIDAANMSAQALSAAAGQSSTAPHDSWGVAVAALFEKLCEPKLVQPTFVIDHPIEISPLTKVKRGDSRLVERFEPFACSMELGNAYSELTDPVEQLARLRSQRRGKEGKDYEDHPLDADFIKAVGCGMPPTGGVGLGIDRVIMLLTNAPSIRDVIPFPMVKSLALP